MFFLVKLKDFLGFEVSVRTNNQCSAPQRPHIRGNTKENPMEAMSKVDKTSCGWQRHAVKCSQTSKSCAGQALRTRRRSPNSPRGSGDKSHRHEDEDSCKRSVGEMVDSVCNQKNEQQSPYLVLLCKITRTGWIEGCHAEAKVKLTMTRACVRAPALSELWRPFSAPSRSCWKPAC